MLVLTRRLDESIKIGTDIEIKIIDIKRHSVKLGIAAPKSVSVFRKELYEAIQEENIMAAQAQKDVQLLKGLIKQDTKGTIKEGDGK